MSVPPAVAGGSTAALTLAWRLSIRPLPQVVLPFVQVWRVLKAGTTKSKFHPSVGARWSLDLFSSPALWITIHFPQVSPSIFGFEHLAEFSLISDTTRLTWPTAFFQATDVEWNICCFLRRPAFLKALETSSWELVFNSKQPELLHRS
jgi:hypothetical protein